MFKKLYKHPVCCLNIPILEDEYNRPDLGLPLGKKILIIWLCTYQTVSWTSGFVSVRILGVSGGTGTPKRYMRTTTFRLRTSCERGADLGKTFCDKIHV